MTGQGKAPFGDYQLEIYLAGLTGTVPALPMAYPELEARAAQALAGHLAAQDGRPLLLYGVTGSGKTEVYLDAVARTRAQESWAKNKGPMALYWKCVGAYASHLKRVLRT